MQPHKWQPGVCCDKSEHNAIHLLEIPAYLSPAERLTVLVAGHGRRLTVVGPLHLRIRCEGLSDVEPALRAVMTCIGILRLTFTWLRADDVTLDIFLERPTNEQEPGPASP